MFFQSTSTGARGSKDPCWRETTEFLRLARMCSWPQRQPREILTSNARTICAAFIAPPSFPSWSCKDFVTRSLDPFANSQRVTSVCHPEDNRMKPGQRGAWNFPLRGQRFLDLVRSVRRLHSTSTDTELPSPITTSCRVMSSFRIPFVAERSRCNTAR